MHWGRTPCRMKGGEYHEKSFHLGILVFSNDMCRFCPG
jgi:hypothetical protein